MRNIIMAMFLSMLSCIGFTQDNQYSNTEDLNKQVMSYLTSQNLPLPNSGIQIVSGQKLSASQYTKNKDFQMLIEQRKNGYVKEDNIRAKELMDFQNTAAYQYQKFANDFSPGGTQLRHSVDELKMAYTFLGVSKSDMSNYIGIAPFGAYHENGWDGAVQFFDNKKIGSCAYTEHNISLSHGGARLAKEAVVYEVNGKPTLLLVKGSDMTGYVYEIHWFDNVFAHTLECANNNYQPSITQNVIELANRIDNNT